MLNADDPYTLSSRHRLTEAIGQKRPLVLWVGAGASRWAGLPSWRDCAARTRKAFARYVQGFPDEEARRLISTERFPALFQLCKDADAKLYNRLLVDQFSSPVIGNLYNQLIAKLKGIVPLQIVTTNIDLCLELNLGVMNVIERNDLERSSECIQNGTPFVAKLHGSVSDIQSVVFSTDDYQRIKRDAGYISAVRAIFSQASVIFLAYGVKDDYVLKLIAEDDSEHRLFGNGPHFRVTDSPSAPLNGLYSIGFRINVHGDHRAALTVLDLVDQAKSLSVFEAAKIQENPERRIKESGFYISDFKPSGTHPSGQTVTLANAEDEAFRATMQVGLGFVQGELPSSQTVAFHDLAVGLMCFDRVFLPLDSLGLLHERATSPVFWALVDSGALKFIDILHFPSILSRPGEPIGDIGVYSARSPEDEDPRPSMTVVRKMLKPAPGMEAEGEKRIESLSPNVTVFADSERLGLPAMVRDALLLPHVSQLLGFSDYLGPANIPSWLAHPTLRLAHLVQTGMICDQFQIRAARVPFGGVSLLSAAFSVKPAAQSVYEYASYVLTGAYGSNLSTFIEQHQTVLLSVLKFRESSEGEALRREVADRIATNEGAEFSAAIEGGLAAAIPLSVIQSARNKFSTLIRTDSAKASATAIWADSNTDDRSLRLWRERSRELLWVEAKARGAKSDSACICGSGDRLRDCCLRPLN